jgi:hypothetical protein
MTALLVIALIVFFMGIDWFTHRKTSTVKQEMYLEPGIGLAMCDGGEPIKNPQPPRVVICPTCGHKIEKSK